MIDFSKDGELLLLHYSAQGRNVDEHWISARLEEDEYFDIHLKKTFHFKKRDLLKMPDEQDEDQLFEGAVYTFQLGKLDGEYYKIEPGAITRRLSLFFYEDIEIALEHFVADNDVSIFRNLEELVDEDIYIGGEHLNSIPITAYNQMVDNFPTVYEKKTYAQARIAAILKNYLESTKDSETRYTWVFRGS